MDDIESICHWARQDWAYSDWETEAPTNAWMQLEHDYMDGIDWNAVDQTIWHTCKGDDKSFLELHFYPVGTLFCPVCGQWLT